MIMTAHIQYPALDDSKLTNKFGKRMIKPATLSHKILTGLLREQLNYQGLIVTDALDMAGISDFFSPTQAVLQTFKAGADIAMMPMKIEMPADIARFKSFIDELALRTREDTALMENIEWSVNRIVKLKQKYLTGNEPNQNVETMIARAKSILANEQHQLIEQQLAQQAIVEVKPMAQSLALERDVKRVHVMFPKSIQAQAMANALHANQRVPPQWQITWSSAEQQDELDSREYIDASDLVIVASDSQVTAVELGGALDIAKMQGQDNTATRAFESLRYAKGQDKMTIFIPLNMPYHLAEFAKQADWILATFDGKAYIEQDSGRATSSTFDALAAIISGHAKARGALPITLKLAKNIAHQQPNKQP